MVDVSGKPVTSRRAVAEAIVTMSAETLSLVIDGGGPKGDVLGVVDGHASSPFVVRWSVRPTLSAPGGGSSIP